jgi:PAS domain S-box-containing protein
VTSKANIDASFWIIDCGVNLKNIATLNYSKWEDIDDIDEHFSLETELLIFLDCGQFEQLPSFKRGNFQLLLVSDQNTIPSKNLLSIATFCCFNKEQKIIGDFLNPYVFKDKPAEQNLAPRQLRLICEENGTLHYQDQGLLNFFNLEGKDPLHLTDLPIKFRFGDYSVFEPMKGLLNLQEAHSWMSFRSTESPEVFRVYLNKTLLTKGDKTFIIFLFSLWPETSQIEKTFKAQIAAFGSILEESFEAILIYDSSKIIKYVSPGITGLVGYLPEDLIGVDIASLTFSEDAKLNHPLLAKVRMGELSKLNLQQRIRHKSGSTIWVDLMITDKRSTPGINGIICVFKDINTEKRDRLALEESNMRFQVASRATQDIIWDLDLHSERITWGQNVKEVFGWEGEEINTIQKFLEKVPEENHNALDLCIQRIINNENRHWHCFYDFYCKNGDRLSIEDKGYALHDKNGKAYRIIGAMHDHTPTKKFKNLINEGEEKFRRLFEESLIGVSLIKLENYNFIDCNQALLNILGYRREEILKLSLFELIPLSKRPDFFLQMTFLKQSETAQTFQLDLIRKDQSIIKVALSSFTSPEEMDEPRAWMHILDLSPILQTSAALKDAENRFRSYVEKSSDVFVTLNASSIYEYVSPNISKLLGYASSEIVGLNNFDIIHPDDHDAVLKAYSEADGEIGKETRSIFRALHKDGSTLWVEANGKIENTDEGPKAFINIRNVDKEHENELELRKLSLVANKTDNVVVITDQALLVTWANQSFEDLSGYSFTESLAKKLTNLLLSKRDALKIERQLNSKKALKVEIRGLTKSGHKNWIGLSITPVFDSDGAIQNYIFLASDISHRKEQEWHIQENIKLINDQNERLKSFAHISSHSLYAHCQNIESLALELKRSRNTLVKDELANILDERTRSLSASLTSIQSILKYRDPKSQNLQDLHLGEHIEKAKRLLSNEIMINLATIQYMGKPDFKVRFYAPYLVDALYTIFSYALINTKDFGLEVSIDVRLEEKFRVVDIILPREISKVKSKTKGHKSATLFSFKESLELLRYQLQNQGGELKKRMLDDFKIVLSLYFKDSD